MLQLRATVSCSVLMLHFTLQIHAKNRWRNKPTVESLSTLYYFHQTLQSITRGRTSGIDNFI